MNQHTTGVLLAIEGTDGSGKATQVELLSNRLVREGYDVEVIAFPQYHNNSSYFVREYLAGTYGRAASVSPYVASLFYSLDRYHASFRIRQALAEGKIVIADRYTASNLAHQGTKVTNPQERRGFYVWTRAVEEQTLAIPQPVRSIVLNASPEITMNLIALRGNQLDEHEKDAKHLETAAEMYIELCELFPDSFVRLDCSRDGQLLERQVIHEMVWGTVRPLLPDATRKRRVQKVHTNTKPAEKEPAKRTSKSKSLPVSLLAHLYAQHYMLPTHIEGYFVPQNLPPDIMKAYATELKWLHDARIKIAECMHTSSKTQSLLTERDAEDSLWAVQSVIPYAATIKNTYGLTESCMQTGIDFNPDVSTTQLRNHTPKNEFSTLPAMLYADSHASLLELEAEINSWPIATKHDRLQQLLEDNHSFRGMYTYEFDVLCDQRDIETIRKAGIRHVGPCKPVEFTHVTPKVIIDTAVRDLYEACFTRAQALQRLLHDSGFVNESAYAVLLGHHQGYGIEVNADQLMNLSVSSKLRTSMEDAVQHVHPVLASTLWRDNLVV